MSYIDAIFKVRLIYRVAVYKGLDCISIYLHVAWTMSPIETQDSFNH